MKVAIIGANGNIGKHLGKTLAERGDEPIGFIRKEEQAPELNQLGVKTELADIIKTDVSEYASKFQGIDALIFTAGAGGAGVELTKAVDEDGVTKMIEAAEQAGIKRFILVSAFPDAGRGMNISESFEFYMKMKRQADVELAQSALDWTILRPGTLTNDEANGQITLGYAISYDEIPRDDVANVIVELLDQPNTSHKILELTKGKTPIQQAVEKYSN